MDAKLHDNFEKEHREARELVCDAHSCVFSPQKLCRLDPGRVLEVGGADWPTSTGANLIRIWRSSKALAWRTKNVGRSHPFRRAAG